MRLPLGIVRLLAKVDNLLPECRAPCAEVVVSLEQSFQLITDLNGTFRRKAVRGLSKRQDDLHESADVGGHGFERWTAPPDIGHFSSLGKAKSRDVIVYVPVFVDDHRHLVKVGNVLDIRFPPPVPLAAPGRLLLRPLVEVGVPTTVARVELAALAMCTMRPVVGVGTIWEEDTRECQPLLFCEGCLSCGAFNPFRLILPRKGDHREAL
mmetsp:Transcript_9160/g.21387  ORF Transcript_9160/g.21387 Transcript_9160/m.21387 type:complete len:209 (-) Transcript_9160:120-746(-)